MSVTGGKREKTATHGDAAVTPSHNSSYQADGEIVLALVGPLGTDADRVEALLEQRLRLFGYQLKTIRLSQLIEGFSGLKTRLDKSTQGSRIRTYMDGGNELRQRTGCADVLARLALGEIQTIRNANAPRPRTAYFLRTLKNPAELKTLREVFGRGFFAIGASSSYARREQILTQDRQIPEEEARSLLARDQGEEKGHGQQTREAFHLADAFVALTQHDDDNKHQLWRILDLVFGHPFCTPTHEEYAMFLAYAASLRSGDISRQVGAVITSNNGEIIATGANDVPCRGGGLYGPPREYLSWPPSEEARASSSDQRDYMRGFDSNKKRREEIVADIAKRLGMAPSVVRNKLSGSLLDDLTEYGRAVHAEMEALLCCARIGVSPKDGTLYTTTFPCHNCTKHIVAAGLQGVRYIEPYPKSLAEQLHGDAVVVDQPSNDGRVAFQPFHGIGPRRFMDLFSISLGAGREVNRKRELKSW